MTEREKPRLRIVTVSSIEGDYCVEGTCKIRFWARGSKLSEVAQIAESIQRKLPGHLRKLSKYSSRESPLCSVCYITKH